MFKTEKSSLAVNHWLLFTLLIKKHKRNNSGLFCDTIIVSTKCRRNMNDSGSVFCSYKVAGNYPECIAPRFNPGNQLFIRNSKQFFSRKFGYYLKWNIFTISGIFIKRQFGILLREIITQQFFGKNNGNRLRSIRIECLHFYIPDVGSNRQCSI